LTPHRAPPLQIFKRQGTHRLIPSRFSEGGTVLEDIATGDAMLADIMLLDGATNDRLQGEEHGLSGISQFELVYGIPNAHIIRAAFLHTSHFGSRFNDATRGAWYAAGELETSIAEVTYHKARRLAEMVVPELPQQMPDKEATEYDDWLADFHAAMHALEPEEAYAELLRPEPIPQCYTTPQGLARQLLEEGSNGLIYPSVRREGGHCVVCFRPALVYRPRPGGRYELRLTLQGSTYKTTMRAVRGG
jgi:RES domain-containing protein